MVSATRILGYTDRISAAPGDTIAFKISCDGLTRYHADIVRLVCADPDPSGPGLRFDTISMEATGWQTGRRQPIFPGSYVVVPPSPSLAHRDGLSLGAMIFPTTPGKGQQTILGQWDQTNGTGYALGLDADGALALTLGDGQKAQIVSTGTPLPSRQWAFVAAGFDAGTGDIWVCQQILKPLALAPTEVSVTARMIVGSLDSAGIPLMMAAHIAARDGNDVIAGRALQRQDRPAPRHRTRA